MKDQHGNDLPCDDDKPWSPVQKYVWEKVKGSLDKRILDNFQLAERTKDQSIEQFPLLCL